MSAPVEIAYQGGVASGGVSAFVGGDGALVLVAPNSGVPGGRLDLGDGMTAVSVGGQTHIVTGGNTLGTSVHVALANYRLTGDSRYLVQAQQLAGEGLLSSAALQLAIVDVFDDTGLRQGAMQAYAMEGPAAATAATLFFGRFKINNRDFHGPGGVKDDILSAAGPKNYEHIVGTNPDVRVQGNQIILRGTAPGVKGKEYPTGLKPGDFFGKGGG